MLVLSRRLNEQIILGNNTIVMTVVRIVGDRVVLGFDAAAEIPINRREVHERIQRQNQSNNEVQ